MCLGRRAPALAVELRALEVAPPDVRGAMAAMEAALQRAGGEHTAKLRRTSAAIEAEEAAQAARGVETEKAKERRTRASGSACSVHRGAHGSRARAAPPVVAAATRTAVAATRWRQRATAR